MKPSNQSYNPKPFSEDADEKIMRNLARNDQLGAASCLKDSNRRMFINDIVSAYNEQGEHRIDNRRFQKRVIVGAIAAAVSAVFFSSWLFSSHGIETAPKTAPIAITPSQEEFGEILSVHGNVTIDGKAAAPGDNLRTSEHIAVANGHASFAPSTGIRVALSGRSGAVIRRTRDGKLDVSLEEGTLWATVDPTAKRERLQITTPHGRVTVKGTIFSVTHRPSASEVSVLRGTVEIVDKTGQKYLLSAGHRRIIGRETEAITKETLASDWKRLASFSLIDAVPDQDVSSIDIDMAQPPPAEKTTLKQSNGRRTSSVSELLAQVRQHRRKKEWSAAASSYETLIQQYPDTAAGRVALVSLGELQLRDLHNPRQALKLFNRYLEGDARELIREAMFGKARALKKMGSFSEEQMVLRRFLDRFPNALQRSAVEARLTELEKYFE